MAERIPGLGLIGSPITGSDLAESYGSQRFEATTGDVAGAVFKPPEVPDPVGLGETIRDNANETGFITDPVSGATFPVPQDKMLTPEQATNAYGITTDSEGYPLRDADGLPVLQFKKPVAESVAKQQHDDYLEKLLRENTLSRAKGGVVQTAVKYGVPLIMSMTDPVNVAAAFIPVVGELRYAKWLEDASGAFGRAGIRAGVGAAQGAVGTAALQPLEYIKSDARNEDFSMSQALTNIAMGTALGGGMHAALGGIFGDHISPDTREAAMRSSIAALAEGRDVRADLPIRDQLIADGERAGKTPLNPAAELMRSTEEAQIKSHLADLEQRIAAPDELARVDELNSKINNKETIPSDRDALQVEHDNLMRGRSMDELRKDAARNEDYKIARDEATRRMTEITTERAAAATRLTADEAAQARSNLSKDANNLIESQRKPAVDPADAATSKEIGKQKPSDGTVESLIKEQQAHLDVANEMIRGHADAGRITPAELEHLNGTEVDAEASTLSKAYEAAASCLASGV